MCCFRLFGPSFVCCFRLFCLLFFVSFLPFWAFVFAFFCCSSLFGLLLFVLFFPFWSFVFVFFLLFLLCWSFAFCAVSPFLVFCFCPFLLFFPFWSFVFAFFLLFFPFGLLLFVLFLPFWSFVFASFSPFFCFARAASATHFFGQNLRFWPAIVFCKFFNMQSRRKRGQKLNAIYLRSQNARSNRDRFSLDLHPQNAKTQAYFVFFRVSVFRMRKNIVVLLVRNLFCLSISLLCSKGCYKDSTELLYVKAVVDFGWGPQPTTCVSTGMSFRTAFKVPLTGLALSIGLAAFAYQGNLLT